VKKSQIVDLSSSAEKKEIAKRLGVVEVFNLSSKSDRERICKKLGLDRVFVKTIPYVVCPLCALSRPLRRTGAHNLRTEKKGSKKTRSERSSRFNPDKEITFSLFNPETSPFVSIRVSLGRKGFAEKKIITFRDIKTLPQRDQEILLPLVREIRKQCEEILKTTEDLVK